MKALWAIEPFHQDKKNTKEIYNLIKQLAGKPSNIEAGFIVTRRESELHLAFDIPFGERFSSYPLKILQDKLKSANIVMDKKNIHVVDFESFSTTKAVDRLLLLGKSINSDLIALQTQALKGYKRIMFGSFAETTIHRSKIDLLLVNPKTNFSSKIKNIFYASAFSPSPKLQLKKVLYLCKKLEARLTVFHVTQVIYKWSLDESNPEILAYRRKISKTNDWIAQAAKAAQVPCQVTLSSELGSVTDLTLKNAKKVGSDLIVVSAKAGPMAALMGGSITRQIVRNSSKPILILKHK